MTDLVLVGCYTAEANGNGTGISAFRREPGSEVLTLASTLPMTSPSWLAKHPTAPIVYATNETATGEVTSVAVDAEGELTALDVAATGGGHPCHLAVTPDGRFLLCANYSGGSAAVFALRPDGRIGARTTLVQYHGTGPRADRQEAAHVHMVVSSSDSRMISVVDLGTDQIRSYRLREDGTLTPLAVSPLPPGTGPRQLVRHEGTDLAYVAGELSGKLLTLRENSPGAFEVVDAVDATAGRYSAENLVAHLEISGSRAYLSSRGPDCVTEFTTEPATPVVDQPCGAGPRHFALDGGRCFVAAQDEDALFSFPVADLGKAEPRRHPTGSPSFVLPLTVA
ncbi:lactonase family protein [Amycolatopsis sp. CA-230715]|uniref:lactonase family protein n=1 Tax=Amycolatopsis sp. CA-230715 TaxID=2745196 RepID=UPI001C02E04D|nr:beta-propeller fold lactonase family protein [Amycolatopsis sp. CA-230715]QWF85119.1 6-phosphogluconolactonase [Amycolatopsis sp. CA-230715]